MMEQDNLSRADMLRNPMAPIPPSNHTLPSGGLDLVPRFLRHDAELLELPTPDPMRALVETSDTEAQQLLRES